MSGVPGKRLAFCFEDQITTLPMAVVASVETSLLMIGSAPMRLISIRLKVFLAALASAIGIYFIWIGITGDPIVIGLVPIYAIIVVWSVAYYFLTRRN
jgi:hypothetical protein